jgi:chemotaxis protein CheX
MGSAYQAPNTMVKNEPFLLTSSRIVGDRYENAGSAAFSANRHCEDEGRIFGSAVCLIVQGDYMSTAVQTQHIITIHDLELGLERALKEITTTMFNCESQIIPPDQVDVVLPGISAIVGFGGKICGFIAMHLSAKSACQLAEGLLGMQFEGVDEIVADAMGEMVNMLAGGLKKFASNSEDLFKISVPSIVYGTDYSTRAPKNSERLVIGVRAGDCSFNVQLVYAAH